MSDESVGAEEQFDLAFYTDCPVCNAPLSSCGRDEVEAHLTNHFADAIKEKISEASDPLGDGSSGACPECNETHSDLTMHFGIAHGATAEMVVDHVKSMRNTKGISLPLNFEKVCRICQMDFGFKNVDPPGIRKHLLTHHNYRKDILDAAEAVRSGGLKSGKFYLCPEYGCGFATQSRSTLTDSHLAVYHQYLQKLYDGDKLKPKCKPSTPADSYPSDLQSSDGLKDASLSKIGDPSSLKEVKKTESPWSLESSRPSSDNNVGFGYHLNNFEKFQSATQNGHVETKGSPEKKKTQYYEYRQKKGFVKSEKQPAESCDHESAPFDALRAHRSVQLGLCSICQSEIPNDHYCNHLAVHAALKWREIQKNATEDKCRYCLEASNNMPMHLKQYHLDEVFAEVIPQSLRQSLPRQITLNLQERLHKILIDR